MFNTTSLSRPKCHDSRVWRHLWKPLLEAGHAISYIKNRNWSNVLYFSLSASTWDFDTFRIFVEATFNHKCWRIVSSLVWVLIYFEMTQTSHHIKCV